MPFCRGLSPWELLQIPACVINPMRAWPALFIGARSERFWGLPVTRCRYVLGAAWEVRPSHAPLNRCQPPAATSRPAPEPGPLSPGGQQRGHRWGEPLSWSVCHFPTSWEPLSPRQTRVQTRQALHQTPNSPGGRLHPALRAEASTLSHSASICRQ